VSVRGILGEPARRTEHELAQAAVAGAAPKKSLRPSGEFDALETDFFAREADLYKETKVADFSDLDKPGKR